MKLKTLIITIIFAVSIIIIGYFFFKNVGFCTKPFNEDYYKWFPYNPGDTVVFMSDTVEIKYVVSYYITKHNYTYLKNAKCGCCEEGISICMLSKSDSIEIEFDNFGNSESCFGEFLCIGNFVVQSNELKIQTKKERNALLEYISVRNDTIVLTKSVGISSLIKDNRIFSFRKRIKSNREITKQSNYCN